MASKWFDYNSYMSSKLAQVQKTMPDMTMTGLVKAFTEAGFVGADGAEQHFLAHGQYEELAPNAFFNATEYYRAKAADYYGYTDPKAVTELDVANVKIAFANGKMSAWEHYKMFGNAEGVNPSNSFDTEAYMTAKLDAMNAGKAAADKITMADLVAGFQKAGISALEHFMMYGGSGEGEVAQKYEGKIPSAFAVPEEKQVVSDVTGNTFTLTTGIDNFTGTAGNDVFVTSVSATATDNTLNPGDQLDGGAGTDTLKVAATTTVGFAGATVKNIEVVDVMAGATNITSIDVTGVTELEHLKLDAGAITSGDFTVRGLNANDRLTLKGLKKGVTVTYDDADGTDDSATIFVDNANIASGTVTVDNIETLTLKFGGAKAAVGTLDADALETLNIVAGTDVSIGSVTNASALETLVVSGAGAVDVALNQTAAESIKTVTAGDGDLTLDLSAASSAGAGLSFTGGKGNDTLKLDITVMNKATSVVGGEGTDTLILSDGGTLNAASFAGINKATGFEVLGFGATATVDMSLIKTAFESYEVYGAGTSYSATFSNIADKTNFEVDFTGAASTSFNGLTLDAKNILSSVNLTLDNNLDAAVTVADLTIGDNISQLTLHSLGGDKASNELTDLTLHTNVKVMIDGDADIEIVATLASGSAIVDASGLTGKAALDYTTGAGNETVTGSANNDTFTKGVTSGLDTFHGGKGADSVVMTNCVSAASKLTLTFDDGDSVGAGGSMKLADMLTIAADSQTWDAVTGMDNTASSVGNTAAHLLLDTKEDATTLKSIATAAAFDAAGGFGKVTVDNKGDFYVVLEGGTSMAVVFQDTNLNGVIDSDDFMITVTGTAAWAANDFTVAGGDLTITNQA